MQLFFVVQIISFFIDISHIEKNIELCMKIINKKIPLRQGNKTDKKEDVNKLKSNIKSG